MKNFIYKKLIVAISLSFFLLGTSYIYGQGLIVEVGPDNAGANSTNLTGGQMIIGRTTSRHLAIDRTDVQARSGTNGAQLALNFRGGNISMVPNSDNAAGKVGIGESGDANITAKLHIKQPDGGEEALAIENDDAGGSDIWALEVGTNDLIIYYNGVQKGVWNDTNGAYTMGSDRNLKTDIQSMENGVLEKLLKLRPTTYYYKDDKERNSRSCGFIAQEVQQLFPTAVKEFDDDSGFLGITYQELTIFTIKALQEQQIVVQEKEKEIGQLTQKVAVLENQLKKVAHLEEVLAKADALEQKLQSLAEMEERLYQMENGLQSCCLKANETSKMTQVEGNFILETNAPQLEQNQPNPFYNETKIQYYLPSHITKAALLITDVSGKVLKSIPIEGTGFGNISIKANELFAGNFNYSLLIDGKVTQTKKMVLTR